MGGNNGDKNPPDKSKNKPLRTTVINKTETIKIIPRTDANADKDDKDQADKNPILDEDSEGSFWCNKHKLCVYTQKFVISFAT